MPQVHVSETTPLNPRQLDEEQGLIQPQVSIIPFHMNEIAPLVRGRISPCHFILIVGGIIIILTGAILLAKYVKH